LPRSRVSFLRVCGQDSDPLSIGFWWNRVESSGRQYFVREILKSNVCVDLVAGASGFELQLSSRVLYFHVVQVVVCNVVQRGGVGVNVVHCMDAAVLV